VRRMDLYHVTIETVGGTEGRLVMLPTPPQPPKPCICGRCGMQCYHFRGRSRCCDAPTTAENWLDLLLNKE
jgi:hypothetical protein